MKKLTKTLLGILSLCFIHFALNSCQEEVYPDTQQLEPISEKSLDQKAETEDLGEHEGIEPK